MGPDRPAWPAAAPSSSPTHPARRPRRAGPGDLVAGPGRRVRRGRASADPTAWASDDRRSVSPAPARRSSPCAADGRRSARPSCGPTAGPAEAAELWPSASGGAEAVRQRTGLPLDGRRGGRQAGLAGRPRARAARPGRAGCCPRGTWSACQLTGEVDDRPDAGLGDRLLRPRRALIARAASAATPGSSPAVRPARPPWSASCRGRGRPPTSACRRDVPSSSAPATGPARCWVPGATTADPDGVVGHDGQRVPVRSSTRPERGRRPVGRVTTAARSTAGWSRAGLSAAGSLLAWLARPHGRSTSTSWSARPADRAARRRRRGRAPVAGRRPGPVVARRRRCRRRGARPPTTDAGDLARAGVRGGGLGRRPVPRRHDCGAPVGTGTAIDALAATGRRRGRRRCGSRS